MSDKIIQLFPADDFDTVLDCAKGELSCALIIGYNSNNRLTAYGGGLINGKRPVQKDWLWLIEEFKLSKLSLIEWPDNGDE